MRGETTPVSAEPGDTPRRTIYAGLIGEAIGCGEAAMLRLVEHFMRITSPTLDGLSGRQFTDLARESFEDVVIWAVSGPSDETGGFSLRDVCAVEGIAYPESLDAIATRHPNRSTSSPEERPAPAADDYHSMGM